MGTYQKLRGQHTRIPHAAEETFTAHQGVPKDLGPFLNTPQNQDYTVSMPDASKGILTWKQKPLPIHP